MDKLYNYFENLYNSDKLSQAFLIGNVSFNLIKNDLYKIINKFILETNVNCENNPNIIILSKEDGCASKDDIKDLINKLSLTSQFENKKIYIIDKCELLNDYAYNAILKTLEEPEKGIYAFLITNNIDSVKSTISSRCQKLFISSGIENNYLLENIEEADSIIKKIENDGINTIVNYPKIYIDISNKEYLLNLLKYMLEKYTKTLNYLIKYDKINEEYLKSNNILTLSRKILVINDNINRLKGNLNKNLSIDRLIIEMWRCNNENYWS